MHEVLKGGGGAGEERDENHYISIRQGLSLSLLRGIKKKGKKQENCGR